MAAPPRQQVVWATRVSYGNDEHLLLVVPKDDLKRKRPHAARAMPIANANETLGIGLNVRKRNVHRNTEIASGYWAMLRAPIRVRL